MPYGTVIVKDSEIIIRGYNTAQTDGDVSTRVEFNALREFTKQFIDLGTKQIDISCLTVVQNSFQDIEVMGGILTDECLELFQQLDN